jgi:hypothetical protein
MRVATVAPLLELEFWEQIALSCCQIVFESTDDQTRTRDSVFVAVYSGAAIEYG